MSKTATVKRYLLIAGCNYYPERSDGDWIGFFDSQEEAEACIAVQEDCSMFGPQAKYRVNNSEYLDDWYEIIDMKKFEGKDGLCS